MEQTSGATKGQLEILRERVERWRAERKGGPSRMPEELWQAAVEVARTQGVYATSKAMRCHTRRLKARMEQGAAKRASATSAPAFVEVATLPAAPREMAGRITVELENRSGERVRIEATDARALDVLGLARAFWSGQR